MSLTSAQEQRLIEIHRQANQTYLEGGDEALLLSLYPLMGDLKKIMDASTQKELDEYCEKYDGFYRCMKLLENLAKNIANGSLSVP